MNEPRMCYGQTTRPGSRRFLRPTRSRQRSNTTSQRSASAGTRNGSSPDAPWPSILDRAVRREYGASNRRALLGLERRVGVSEPKAGKREWIGLAVIALPCLLYSMDLTVLHLAVPRLTLDLKPSSV